ncbi:hypothetical protein SAMN04487995_3572 [Dyadobacter koreensis]|uniref:Uncharacterized protein n=1 Tax=Dyadobacter koreensis TaxID=408657 RepID=A0A1H6WWD4_9BACT|nr:hypothetical protein SAMN04487995_3572 [Dyadobacter koreensis]
MTESQYRAFHHPLLAHAEIQNDFHNLLQNVIEENLSFLTPAEKQGVQQTPVYTLFITLTLNLRRRQG